jgi:phage tail-like protein
VPPLRTEPYKADRFVVKFDGKTPVPGILRVSPLRRVTAAVAERAGGDAPHDTLTPGTTRWEPIVLERGRSPDTAFEDWANLVAGEGEMSLKNYRKSIRLELLDEQGRVAMAFTIHHAWPSEYVALGQLDSEGETVALESLTLEYEGWERDLAVHPPADG